MVGPILAKVKFRGTIRERSVEPYLRILRFVREKSKFRGLLLDISSGGGEDIASTDLYLAVKRVSKVKPVVAAVGAIAASGAYMAALGAHRIYAYEESEVGSIGVIMPHFAAQRLLEKIGVEVELLHHGRHKDAYQGLRSLTPEEREKLLKVGEVSYNSFVDVVARERRRPREEILKLATGEFWSGKQALAMGLIDALGDREKALEDLAHSAGVPAKRTVELSPPKPFFERLAGGPVASLGFGLSQGIRTSVQDAIEDVLLYGRRYR
ncbi:MAG: signal peptide peptidase SppA [Euryarchaeota archaeon]|nr:signal peptide peptidase SppA [Euryarchaeota archaeon]MDE1835312.1 signal peptide peptidase SppA [Euryarchaeota archaeon]MDE1880583.1 signal peptide peptidase SppA [Euryarchaeota archaeon]MDE2043608.1 signal peptide peptidase SppA [Thermoplasmata archaeon]